MGKIVLGPLGVVMAVFPNRVLAAFERLFLENPDECEAKSWVTKGVRFEGLAYLLIALRGGKPFGPLAKVFGLFGLVAFLFPKRYLAFGSALAYGNADACEWKRGSVQFARVVGGLVLLLSLVELRSRR